MLSQTVGYAILALGYIGAVPGRPVLVREIAAATEIPTAYLAKIVHQLGKKGILTTQRGIGGGVALSRDPAELTLFDLCVALDDPVIHTRCMLGTADCSDERACPAHEFWTAERERHLDFLCRTTLEDVVRFEARRMRGKVTLLADALGKGDGPKAKTERKARNSLRSASGRSTR